jgi:GTP-binding protein
LLNKSLEVYQNFTAELPLEEVDSILKEAIEKHPATEGRKYLKLYQVENAGVKPPTFNLYVNVPDLADESYLRYLENCLRARFPLEGSPIKLLLRKRKKAALKLKEKTG